MIQAFPNPQTTSSPIAFNCIALFLLNDLFLYLSYSFLSLFKMRSNPLLLPILMVLVVEIDPGEAVESSPADEAGQGD